MAKPWPGAKRGETGGPRIPWHGVMDWGVSAPVCATGVSLIASGCLSGATPRGPPWTFAVTLPHGCRGLNARRMAALWTLRAPALGRHVHRALLRSVFRDVAPIIAATAYHQRNDVERYSRCMAHVRDRLCCQVRANPWHNGLWREDSNSRRFTGYLFNWLRVLLSAVTS